MPEHRNVGEEPPIAVIDVGSNTVRLLVARERDGRIEHLRDRSAFVRLGLGVHASGRLRPDREGAALAAVRELIADAKRAGARHILAVATSAVRDAENGQEFAFRVRQATGIPLRILSGEDEARLTYVGATEGRGVSGTAIVCDLGGGSMEIIYGKGVSIVWSSSLPLGSGRLTERFVRHDPPTAGELADASRAVDDALRRLPAARPNHVVLTGGTATHVALIAGSTDQSVRLESTALDRIAVALAALPAGAIVDAYHVDPQRARVLPVGAVELKTVARFYAATSVVITRHGIREGVIIEERESAKDGPADG